MQVPDFYVGSPIDPPDLWYRNEFVAELWDSMKTQHIILSAPRRTGKTSILDFMAANPEDRFEPIPVFVQDISHPADFILLMLDLFHEKYPNLFRKTFQKGGKLIGRVLRYVDELEWAGFKIKLRQHDPEWQNNWREYGDEFFTEVRKGDDKILLLVDEFPDMILNINKIHPQLVQPFLEWFRGHRLNPHPKQDKVHWLICGSVNLSGTLDALGCLDKINDLTVVSLPVLTKTEVEDFVQRMLSGREVVFDEIIPRKVAEILGRPVPFFLQMITQDIYRIWIREHRKLDVQDVEKAFADLIVSSGARDKLQHFYSRIDKYYQHPKDMAAYALLAELSLSSDGISRKSLMDKYIRIMNEQDEKGTSDTRKNNFNQLLRDLENDFYIVEVRPEIYDFASGLIKQWWKKYYA